MTCECGVVHVDISHLSKDEQLYAEHDRHCLTGIGIGKMDHSRCPGMKTVWKRLRVKNVGPMQ